MGIDTSSKVMIVDDMSTMLRIERNILKQMGYENVIQAENGKEALKLAQKERPDLVITDWNMPEMPGIDMVRAIRADATLSKVPIIMVTAESKKSQVVEALKAGVNNYVVKPFTPKAFMDAINAVIAKFN